MSDQTSWTAERLKAQNLAELERFVDALRVENMRLHRRLEPPRVTLNGVVYVRNSESGAWHNGWGPYVGGDFCAALDRIVELEAMNAL